MGDEASDVTVQGRPVYVWVVICSCPGDLAVMGGLVYLWVGV